MCGIAGMVGPSGEAADAATLWRMCQTLVHRGPDDEGTCTSGSVGLGIRRLSIIDLVAGHQPIANEDRSIWVACNGEIYNFPELRRELESRGHQFRTRSDVEVIVHLYEELGADCVTRLRGMFAFALYDENRTKLILARDRLGKKPLYYAQQEGRFLFASEIKAMLAVAPQLAELDHAAVLQYFYFGYVPDPNSAFRHIRKLPPGHVLEYSAGQAQVRQFWDLPAYGTHPPASEEDCLNELERRLSEAVRMRLVSDVPLGALLSGGVDSSVVVALMARAQSRPVKTFTIGFREEHFDETRYARMVAERFAAEHHELVVEPQIEGLLDQLTQTMEEPFADSSMIPTYYLCQMTRRHVTVALSGDGGDELFAGYDRYANSMDRVRMPSWIGEWYRQHIYDHVPMSVYGRYRGWNSSLSRRDAYLDELCYLRARDRDKQLFSPEFLESAGHLAGPVTQYRYYYDSAPASDHLGRIQYLDTKTYLPADILTKVDRMSMANSLEVRCPLLDHEVVEWVTALPLEWKLRKGTAKYLLRKLALRLGVPAPALERRKQGFQLPLREWMKAEPGRDLFALLTEPRALQRAYFRPQAVLGLIDEHLRGRRDRSAVLWQLLVFELWHRNFLDARMSAAELRTSATEPLIARPA